MFKKALIITGHILFWVVGIYIITKVFGISTVEVMMESDGQEKVVVEYDDHFIWATIVTVGLCAILSYSNIFVLLPDYFRRKKILNYLSKFILFFVLGIALSVVYNRFVNYSFSKEDGLLFFPSFGLHVALFFFYSALSFVYAFTIEWYRNEKIRNQILQEKLTTELNFLKAQINPHFLFNTLNNLFSIAQKHNISELTTGISELSKLMRYMLYESDTAFVSLQKEVNYLESFIEVQKLRYEDEEFIVNFDKKGKLEAIQIAPMILLPFVENAFKHGISIEETSMVNILLDVTDGNIYFRVKNKIFEDQQLNESASGIGLDNVKKRLNLIYPEKHDLKIKKGKTHYTIELNIECRG